jgi:TolB-like protein
VIGRTFHSLQRQERRPAVLLKSLSNPYPEGSVRKDGNKIRVSAQLIKASDGSHLGVTPIIGI